MVGYEDDRSVGPRRRAERHGANTLPAEESRRRHDQRPDRGDEQILVTGEQRTIRFVPIDCQRNPAQPAFSDGLIEDALKHRPRIERASQRADFPSEHPQRLEQMECPGSLGAHQIDGHRLRQRRPTRKEVRRRSDRGQAVGKCAKSDVRVRPFRPDGRRGLARSRRNVGRSRQGSSLFVINPLDEAGHLAQAGLESRGQPLTAGHHLKAPSPASHEQRLKDAVPPHRLHEIGRRRVITIALQRVDGAHIEMPDWCGEQRRIQFFDVVGIGPHPEFGWQAFTKGRCRFADMAIQTWFDIRHGWGVPEIARPLRQERPDAG